MSADIYRRCGCRDAAGKQYGPTIDRPTSQQKARACPLMTDSKHGTWAYYLAAGIDPRTKKRRQIRKGGFTTQKAAQKARNIEAVKVDQGRWVVASKDTLEAYLDKWLPRHTRTAQHGKGLRETTLGQYQRYIENDVKGTQLAIMKLGDIRRHHLVEFFDDLERDGRGTPTQHKILVVLQAAFTSALDDRLIDVHPAIRIPLQQEVPKAFNAWTAVQVGQFLDEAAKHRLGALYELAMLTGLRRGELVGLHWSAVDLSGRVISVESTRVQARSGIIEGKPKTEKSIRIVSIDDVATGALIGWKLLQEADRDAWGDAYASSGYVFTYENGEPIKPDYATRLFEKIRARAKLPKITLHGSRHEHASLWIEGGGDITALSKRLGHTSSRITSDIYTHRVGEADRIAAEQVAAMIPRNPAPVHTVHTQSGSGGKEIAPVSASSA